MTRPKSPRRRPSKARRPSWARHGAKALLLLAVVLVFASGLLFDPAALAAIAWAALSGEFGRIVQACAFGILATAAGALLLSAHRARRKAPRRKPRARAPARPAPRPQADPAGAAG